MCISRSIHQEALLSVLEANLWWKVSMTITQGEQTYILRRKTLFGKETLPSHSGQRDSTFSRDRHFLGSRIMIRWLLKGTVTSQPVELCRGYLNQLVGELSRRMVTYKLSK